MYSHFITDLIGLPDFALQCMSLRSEGWVAILEPSVQCFVCPVCGSKSTPHKRDKRRTLRHRPIPHFGFIYVEVPVYHEQCTSCQAVWSVEWKGIPQRGNVTEIFKNTVISLCRETTIQSVSRTYDIPYSSLERWYYEWAESESARISSERNHPKIISIDDFSIQKGHKYALSIADYETAQICQVTKGRSGDSIKKALKQWPYEKPELAIVDLAPAYLNTIREAWPETKLAADPFHVIQLFTRELDKSRRKLLKNEKSQFKKRHATRLLTTKPRNLSCLKECLQLEEWLSHDKGLEELYQSLQGIRRVFAKWKSDFTRKAFKSWVEAYMFSPNEAVRRIVKTLVQWEDAIINAIQFGVSNGRMEGLNNKTKMIKRRGYGYRNLNHFERRLQLETVKTG